MKAEVEAAREAWPDHQVVKVASWKPRSLTPPVGNIWASDGSKVWLIRSDGPIPASATAVRFWTEALIPAPPLGPIIDIDSDKPELSIAADGGRGRD